MALGVIHLVFLLARYATAGNSKPETTRIKSILSLRGLRAATAPTPASWSLAGMRIQARPGSLAEARRYYGAARSASWMHHARKAAGSADESNRCRLKVRRRASPARQSEAALSNVPLVFGALLVVGAMGTLIYVVSAIASAASPGGRCRLSITPSASTLKPSEVTIMADIRSSWKWRPAGRFPMLIRASQRLCFVALLTAAIAVGKTAAQSERDALMAGRGTVSFPVSCNANLQPRFDAALAALHSFWYGQALKEFTAITEADPECAMAYWGTAMSVWNQLWASPRANNLQRGLDAIEKARLITRKSPRESDYIEALAVFYSGIDKLDHATRAAAYARKMEELAQRYPEDPEAEIFYALALLASADPLDKTYKNQLKAGAMLEKLFAEMPGHPGVSHYIIHAYDYPALADRALAAALNYAVCVTIVPHAIHMPSHTYVLLGRWQDTINANTAAQEAEEDRGTPEDRIHALDYLVYAYLQLGQDGKAKQVLDLALQIENELLASKHDSGLRARPFGIAAMEARWTLERHDWAAAAALPVRPTRYANAEAVSHFARAVGLARSGRPEQAEVEVEALASLQKTLADANI